MDTILQADPAVAVERALTMRVLGIVLAGGKGRRLMPLTRERAKPAVPFGGKYRIVDFVLSNFINSGINSIYVLTQFKSQSLLQHLSEAWQFSGLLKSHFIIPVPAQMRSEHESWYLGTADAILQNINLIEQSDPQVVAVFGADHIYRMNVASMIDFHVARRAEVTVAAIPVPKKEAAEFGVIEARKDGRIVAFHEKNPNAPTLPGDPTQVFASMGNYIFSKKTLLELLSEDANNPESHHDFGKDILPKLAGHAPIYAYDFQTNRIPGEPEPYVPYWRDVGTIDAYYEANMDVRSVKPELNLYNREWPLRTSSYADPPAKFTFDETHRRGEAIDSVVSGGPSCPAARCATRCWAGACASTRTPWWKAASSWTTAISAGTPACAAPSSIRTSAFPRAPASATIWRPTVPAAGTSPGPASSSSAANAAPSPWPPW